MTTVTGTATITFNAPAGPTGPQGATGATGATGPAGPAGAAGAVGATGPAGAVGHIGATGATGPTGPDGGIGPTGAAGPAGLNGAPGVAGSQGTTGVAGAVGAAGAAGEVGPVGPAGPAGPKGDKGDKGDPGTGGGGGTTPPPTTSAWSATNKNSHVAVSPDGLTVTGDVVPGNQTGRCDTPITGPSYWEVTYNVGSGNSNGVGLADEFFIFSDGSWLGQDAHSVGYYSGVVYYNNALLFTADNFNVGDTICMRYDPVTGSVGVKKNGGDWHAATAPLSGAVHPAYNLSNAGSIPAMAAHFKAPFFFTVPVGFNGLDIPASGGGSGGGGTATGGVVDYINAKDYATPKAASDAAIAAGLPLLFPAGGVYPVTANQWTINGALKIKAAGATLRLEPWAFAGGTLVDIVGLGNVEIDGGTWDWNAANIGLGANGTIIRAGKDSPGGSGLTIKNAKIINATTGADARTQGGSGVEIHDWSNVLIEDNEFKKNSAGDYVFFTTFVSPKHVAVRGNKCDATGQFWESINFLNNSGGTQTLEWVDVSNNEIWGAANTQGAGYCAVQLWQNASNGLAGYYNHVTVKNNKTNGGNIGLSITSCQNATVVGNDGFNHIMAVENGSCVNSTFSNNSLDGNLTGDFGVCCTGWGYNNSIAGNAIKGMGPGGMLIAVGHASTSVTGNALYNAPGPTGGVSGVTVFTAYAGFQADGVVVTGNTMSLGGQSNGVKVTDCNRVLIGMNVIDIELPIFPAVEINAPGSFDQVPKDHIKVVNNLVTGGLVPFSKVGTLWGTDVHSDM